MMVWKTSGLAVVLPASANQAVWVMSAVFEFQHHRAPVI